jgi:hypothetical protein
MEIGMRGPRPTAAPTLGVTATLALLWLLAAAQAGPDGPAAAALDPGRVGSIGDWWANLQLALALLACLSIPELRPMAALPLTLLAGEVGEVHIHAARMLAGAMGAQHCLPVLKLLTSLALGAAVLASTLKIRHYSCCGRLVASLVVGGGASTLLDAAHPGGEIGAWAAAIEEWSELSVYSLVASTALSTAIKYHTRTFLTSSPWKTAPAAVSHRSAMG